jgi:acyl-coenzyme A synthetase/AMP-(fatty) acid ligase
MADARVSWQGSATACSTLAPRHAAAHHGEMHPEPDWIATPQLRPDHRGPVDRPYTPFIDPSSAPPILELLHAVARREPDRVAIEDARSRLTFAALLDEIVRLRDDIDRAHPVPARAGILLPPSVEYAVAVFALLAAGWTTVLLDETYPDARNASIARATNLDLILTMPGRTLDWLHVTPLAVAPPGAGSHTPIRQAVGAPGAASGLDEPAFILCTSGSTGEPKPIVHSQRTMLHWARITHEALHVTPDDRALSLSSLSTLGGFTGLIGFPLGGAAIRMFDLRAEGLSGLFNALASREVTILRAVPSMLRGLAALPDAHVAFSGLRAVQTYGEPFLKSDLAALAPLLPPGCVVRSTYGSTEASGLSWFAGEPDDHDPLRVASGILLPDTFAAIVDDTGTSCPPGEVGELIIRSRYNALGELIDGRMEHGRIAPHPSGDGTRVFRTGDMARCTTDGVFVVLGRSDRMVKVNGQRLEPAEIEAVLRQVPGVERGEVVVQPSANGLTSPKLVAFIVAGPGSSPDLPVRVRAELRASLPGFMVPHRVVQVPAIPLLPGGKVDRPALLAHADPDPGPSREAI